MGVFSVSDILVAVTLAVNAAALSSSAFPLQTQILLTKQPESLENEDNQPLLSIPGIGDIDNSNSGDLGYLSALKARVALLFRGVRHLSCLIAIWNMIFVILLVLVFG